MGRVETRHGLKGEARYGNMPDGKNTMHVKRCAKDV
jgi:hypothetical protein